MKPLLKGAVVASLLATPASNAFVTLKNHKPILSKSNKAQKRNDDELFGKLFDEKNKHSLSDNTIHSDIHDYLKNELIHHEEAVDNQKQFLEDLAYKVGQYERITSISNVLDSFITANKLKLKDDVISPETLGDAHMFQGNPKDETLEEKNIYMNDSFISHFMDAKKIEGDNPFIKDIPIKLRIFHILQKTKFDAKFTAYNEFLQQDSTSTYPMTGGIMRGTYKDKTIYFLLTQTLDKQFRLINISDNIDDLKTTQNLK